jgi:hypothetical protein
MQKQDCGSEGLQMRGGLEKLREAWKTSFILPKLRSVNMTQKPETPDNYRVINGRKGAKKRLETLKKRKEKGQKKTAIGQSVSQSMANFTWLKTLTKGDDPLVKVRLTQYGELVGQPADWSACKILEQVRAEAIRTQANQLELDKARGRLVERAELTRALAMVRDAWWIEAQLIESRVLSALGDLSTETRARLKALIIKETQECGELVKARLDALTA